MRYFPHARQGARRSCKCNLLMHTTLCSMPRTGIIHGRVSIACATAFVLLFVWLAMMRQQTRHDRVLPPFSSPTDVLVDTVGGLPSNPFAVLSSLFAVSPASRRFAHAAHCQCRAFVVIYRFAGFTTFLHAWHCAKSLTVPYLVFLCIFRLGPS